MDWSFVEDGGNIELENLLANCRLKHDSKIYILGSDYLH